MLQWSQCTLLCPCIVDGSRVVAWLTPGNIGHLATTIGLLAASSGSGSEASLGPENDSENTT